MNLIRKRLVCLNLALLLIVLTTLPTGAVPVDEGSVPAEIEDPTETRTPIETETPAGAETPAETETATGTEAPTETEATTGTEVTTETETTTETEAPAKTETTTGTEAPAGTETTTVTEATTEEEIAAPLDATQGRASHPTLYLSGNGGQFNGRSYVFAEPISNSSYLNNTFNLGNYVFQKSGSVQAGWARSHASTSTDLIPLTQYHRVSATFTSLEAVWTPIRSGYVILNSMDGTFRYSSNPNYTYRQQRITYQQPGAALPSTENYVPYSYLYNLTGWCSEYHLTWDDNDLCGGQWYAPSDPAPSDVPALYAYEYSVTDTSLVIYHAGAGTVKRGGTILVQNAYRPDALGGDLFIPPENHVFQGWSLTSGGTSVAYKAGDTVPTQNGGPTHLYAVWKNNEVPVDHGLYASWNQEGRTFQVRAEAAYFTQNDYYGPLRAVLALYRDGRLLSTAVSTPQYAVDVTLSASYTGGPPNKCKFFVVGASDFRPLGHFVPITPALLS